MRFWATGWPDAQRQFHAGLVGADTSLDWIQLLADRREVAVRQYIDLRRKFPDYFKNEFREAAQKILE